MNGRRQQGRAVRLSRRGFVARTLAAFAAPAGAALLLLASGGCATSALNSARGSFYDGRFDEAAKALGTLPGNETDRVLVLMELGTINQTRAAYKDSVNSWLRAAAIAERLDYLSVSRQSASMVVNDRLLSFVGKPYERVLLHTFAAQSYLAMGMWEDAGVEGRIAVRRMENRGDFPDDAYSHYVAGLTFDLIRDGGGATFQYRKASEAGPLCSVDPVTGALGPAATTAATEVVVGGSEGAIAKAPPPPPPKPAAVATPAKGPVNELVCLVGMGHGPIGREYSASSNFRWGDDPHAEIYANGVYLGRSYTLSRADLLSAKTEKVIALRQGIKTAARIALKETAAQVLSQQDEALGDLLRLALFALEQPDNRQWETMPQWLAVARVPCPANLTSYEIVFKGAGDHVIERRQVSAPLVRRGQTSVSLCRAL